MIGATLFALFAVLMLAGVPIAAALGVGGIITDHPDKAIRILEEEE